jgi:hypothetical protein
MRNSPLSRTAKLNAFRCRGRKPAIQPLSRRIFAASAARRVFPAPPSPAIRRARLRAAFGPVENLAQIVVATVQGFDETIVPAQKAEEIGLSVLEGVGERQPFEARLGHDRLREPKRGGLKQERAFADVDVGRDDEVAPGERSDLNRVDGGRRLGMTAYRSGFPTLIGPAVKSPDVFTSSARKPEPCVTLISCNWTRAASNRPISMPTGPDFAAARSASFSASARARISARSSGD